MNLQIIPPKKKIHADSFCYTSDFNQLRAEILAWLHIEDLFNSIDRRNDIEASFQYPIPDQIFQSIVEKAKYLEIFLDRKVALNNLEMVNFLLDQINAYVIYLCLINSTRDPLTVSFPRLMLTRVPASVYSDYASLWSKFLEIDFTDNLFTKLQVVGQIPNLGTLKICNDSLTDLKLSDGFEMDEDGGIIWIEAPCKQVDIPASFKGYKISINARLEAFDIKPSWTNLVHVELPNNQLSAFTVPEIPSLKI